MMYDIGGIYLEILSDPKLNLNILSSFKSGYNGMPHSKIDIKSCDEIIVEDKEVLLDDCYKWCLDYGGGTVVYIPSPFDNRIICKLTCDKKWENVTMLYKKNVDGIEDAIPRHFCFTVFRILILYHQGILIHASSFVWNGKGIIVTAPSGTGKSTHVALWEKYYGASVINDDCPTIRFINDEPVLLGNPWSGSNLKFMNAGAPLTAIVIIEQARENSIVKLDKQEAVTRILPRFILPYYDNQLLSMAIECIDKIIETVPVFHLRCKPDREAADIVAERIFQGIR